MSLLSPLTRAPLHRGAALARTTMMIVLPHGGQAGSRRNAWAALSRDTAALRARAEADAALQASTARYSAPTGAAVPTALERSVR